MAEETEYSNLVVSVRRDSPAWVPLWLSGVSQLSGEDTVGVILLTG